MADVLQKSGMMSHPQTKGKLSPNVLMTMKLTLHVQLLYLFLPPHHALGLSCTQREFCLKMILAKKTQLDFKAEMK